MLPRETDTAEISGSLPGTSGGFNPRSTGRIL